MKHPRTSICGALALIFGILATTGGDPDFTLWCVRLAAVFTGLVGYFAHDGNAPLPPVVKLGVLTALLIPFLCACTSIRQVVATKSKDGTEQTTRSTVFSLWDGKAVVDKLRVANSPKTGQSIGLSGIEETTDASTNTLQALGHLRAILGK